MVDSESGECIMKENKPTEGEGYLIGELEEGAVFTVEPEKVDKDGQLDLLHFRSIIKKEF